MKRHARGLCCLGCAAMCGAVAVADNQGDENYSTSFEAASGYSLGVLAPDPDPAFNQPYGPNWWNNWLDGFARTGVLVTDERAHTGVRSIKFIGNPNDPEDPRSSAQHIGVIDADPCDPGTFEWRPMTWKEEFWVYVPASVPHEAIALRAEPWNNWTRLCDFLPFGRWDGYSYQLFIYRVDDGLTNGWRPQLGIDGVVNQANDLRDEMGMDPLFDSFATDKWWKVSIVADGELTIVTSVTISDDSANVFEATGLTDCFSSWGEPCPGTGAPPGDNYCSRPERVAYYGYTGVYLDDISIGAAGTCAGFTCADANCSGGVDAEDIDPFFLALGDAAAYAAQFPDCDLLCNCDVNGSGGVDAEDIDPFFVAVGVGGCP